MEEITIAPADDWHHHLRDGDALATTVPLCAERFARAIVMPNLQPPVTTTAQALAYRERILAALPPGKKRPRGPHAPRTADAGGGGGGGDLVLVRPEDAAEATAIAAEETRIAATRAAEVAQKLAIEAHKLEALARQRTVASVRREKQRQKLEDAAARVHAREQAAKGAAGAADDLDDEPASMPTSDFD